MRDMNKHSKSAWENLTRYLNNEMKGAERNAFEKELQRDPFIRDATEGLSGISADEAADDIEEMKRNLRVRTGRRRHVIYYRIAAVLAALVVISSLFIMKWLEEKPAVISENLRREVPTKNPALIPEPQKIMAPAGRPSSEKKAAAGEKRNHDTGVPEKRGVIPEKQTVEKVAPNELAGSGLKADENADTDKPARSEKPAAAEGYSTNRKIASAQSSPVSMSEENGSIPDYQPPMPVTGMDAFNSYLENNISIPDSGQMTPYRVSLVFMVNKDSTITGIRVVSSPGVLYTREAVRLIKEGPKWKPAMRNNRMIEDSARIDILFR